jgi:hypothetical protein
MTLQEDSGLVVIVEDPFIRSFLRTLLTRAGHRTVELSPQQGVDLVGSGKVHVKALITNTPELFRSVAGELPLIYTTSNPDPDATQGFAQCHVLRKPFQAGQLLDALNEVSATVIP